MNAVQVTKQYFALSNASDFGGIKELLNKSVEYRSLNTGEYSGADRVLAMQTDFHGRFKSLHWRINKLNEIKPNHVVVDYDFEGKSEDGSVTIGSGLEHITVENGQIVAIEIRSKS